MKGLGKFFIFVGIILIVAFFVFQQSAAKEKTVSEKEFKTKLLEFLASLIDIVIKFFQLIQDFFGLIINFFIWLKSLILKI